MNIKDQVGIKGKRKWIWLSAFLFLGGVRTFVKAKYYEDEIFRLQSSLEKMKEYYNMLDRWMHMRESGKSLLTFFSENHYRRIAIYGMGKFAGHLQNELAGSTIDVVFGIDIMSEKKEFSLKTYLPDLFPQDVDAIVVTTNDLKKVKKHLKAITDVPVHALSDILAYAMGDENAG